MTEKRKRQTEKLRKRVLKYRQNHPIDPTVLKRSANNPARDNKVVQTPGE
jgi:hypothetical protein